MKRDKGMTLQPYFEDETIQIFLGDCRDLPAPRCDLVLTDPPYGVKEKTNRKEKGRSERWTCRDFPVIAGDDRLFDPAHLLELNTKTILWGANHYADQLPLSRTWLVWDKREGITSNDNADCELAWSNLGGPARLYHHLWSGVLRASENGERVLHPTQKPVQLLSWCIQLAKLKPNSLIYDPYMGSGPCAVAAKLLGHRYVGVELVESYCLAAVRRLQQEVMVF